MSMTIMERQARLPHSIEILRYNPRRKPFEWSQWNPKGVGRATDLPPYLIMGSLLGDSFQSSPKGWSARWQGLEKDTYFDVAYLAHEGRYELRQNWCGHLGLLSTGLSSIPFDKQVLQASTAAQSWESSAKQVLEENFPLIYVEATAEMPVAAYLPDGMFKTIAIPTSVQNLRMTRKWLDSVITENDVPYPISGKAELFFQAVNYVEGKAPSWTSAEVEVFRQSVAATGLAPHGLPVREVAGSGSAAWTLRRNIYVLLLDLPFAGLSHFLKHMFAPRGLLPQQDNSEPRVEMQPIIMPSLAPTVLKTISYWDKGHTTRCLLQFNTDLQEETPEAIEDVERAKANAEDLLTTAEEASSGILREIATLQI